MTNDSKSDVQYGSSEVSSRSLLRTALVVLNVAVRCYSAAFMIISDCDETFNYWEPLNVLVRRFGKETWEYSPEYAIRSYAYLLPYYLVNYPILKLSSYVSIPSYFQFYWIRLIGLCGLTSLIEIRLTRSLSASFNTRVGNWFLFFSSVSTGMAHAGVALLPSSLAMQTTILATIHSLDSFRGDFIDSSTAALFWFLIGGIIGWPFALALSIPFGLYTLCVGLSKISGLLHIAGRTLSKLVSIVCILSLIDKYFYKFDHIVVVPINIVLYNVFGGEGEGPEIFGVEPFSYYILNLIVNFNIIAVLAYLGLVVNPFIYDYKYRSKVIFVVSLPLLIWSVVFGSQPHKEERFLYPIYPLITLSAALLVAKVFHLFGFITSKLSRYLPFLTRAAQLTFAVLVGTVSILRTVNLVENYSAPLTISRSLPQINPSNELVNVCVGREWYHFPTSFFLPDGYRLRFVKSGFDGLLPGDFLEDDLLRLRDITANVPKDMNNLNQFSESKLIDFSLCDYYIDNSQAVNKKLGEFEMVKGSDGDDLEVDENWDIVSCSKIINPDGNHQGIGRLIYIPEVLRTVVPYGVDTMELCVFQKKVPEV